MLVQSKRVSTTVFTAKPCGSGLIKDKLSFIKPREGIGDIKSLKSPNPKEKTICMPESLPENKKEIYKGKSNILERNIQISKLSQILEADLTLKEKVSEKYWNNFSKAISKKLSYHRQTDLAGSGQENFSCGYLSTSEPNSRYLTTDFMRIQTRSYPKTYWKLLPSLQQDSTEEESIKQITRKIRIYPNIEQKKLFKKCFDAHNYFYNKAVESLRKNSKQKLTDFRKEFIPREKDIDSSIEWMKDIPLDTREEAARKALSALKTGFSQRKSGLINNFELKFRSKKRNTPVFYAAKKSLIEGAIFSRRLKQNKHLVAKRDKQWLNKSDGIFSITKENNKYYINVVIPTIDKKLKPRQNICALDPGVRKFQTMYSLKSVGEFGPDTSKKLINLYRREDRLKSILAKEKLPSAKKYKLKKRCASLRDKAKHIVSDLHWKVANILTKEFQTILLPIFNSKKMANRTGRKISKTSARLLLGLSHYSFQQKLLYKAKVRGRNVILCKEHYTSKCCGSCGQLHEKLGSKKIFKCETCGLTMDRDIHAARNILIRALTTYYKKR